MKYFGLENCRFLACCITEQVPEEVNHIMLSGNSIEKVTDSEGQRVISEKIDL